MSGRAGAWLLRGLALAAAIALIWPASRTLVAARQPMPLPSTTWSHGAGQTTPRPVTVPRHLAPNTVSIPELDVTLPFHDAGTSNGWLDLDNSINSGVRFANGSTLTRGTYLIAAHVNSRDLTQSPFAKLWQVQPGTQVFVSDAKGAVHAFKTVALDHYQKDALPKTLWDTSGDSRVALVTCGGKLTVNPDGTRHYAEIVVVTGVPVNG